MRGGDMGADDMHGVSGCDAGVDGAGLEPMPP
jgi:hypothetical protein